MAALKIPAVYESKKILLADDEPEHLDWLVDFLAAKGFETVVVTTIKEAVVAFEACSYRAYIVDLNIPFGGWMPTIAVPSATYSEYHGLYALKLIRSQGNGGGRVLAYSAHYNTQIVSEIRKLYCKYVVKGRPLELKAEIETLLKKRDVKTNGVRKPRIKPAANHKAKRKLPRAKKK